MKPVGSLFPRGSGPLCSILFPSRGRPHQLVTCIRQIHGLTKNKKAIEVLIKVDEDDIASINISHNLPTLFPEFEFKIVVSPRGNGYEDLHLWVGDLASKARGDWLFCFNDDAKLMTKDWDQHLEHMLIETPWAGINEICYAEITDYKSGNGSFEFFFLRKGVYDLVGRIGWFPIFDYWQHCVMGVIQPKITASILVDHQSPKDQIQRNYKMLRKIMATASDVRKQMTKDIVILSNRLDVIEEQGTSTSPIPYSWSTWKQDEFFQLCAIHDNKIQRYENGKLIDWIPPQQGIWTLISRW